MVARSHWRNAAEGLGEVVFFDIVDLPVVWHLARFFGKAFFNEFENSVLDEENDTLILEGDVIFDLKDGGG